MLRPPSSTGTRARLRARSGACPSLPLFIVPSAHGHMSFGVFGPLRSCSLSCAAGFLGLWTAQDIRDARYAPIFHGGMCPPTPLPELDYHDPCRLASSALVHMHGFFSHLLHHSHSSTAYPVSVLGMSDHVSIVNQSGDTDPPPGFLSKLSCLLGDRGVCDEHTVPALSRTLNVMPKQLLR